MVFKTACTGSIPVIFDIIIINPTNQHLITSTEVYNISGSNDFSELKHLTYRNAKGVFKLKKTQLLVGG